MNYDEWEAEVPEEIKGDSVWKMRVYRLGLFVCDLGWHDVGKLARDRRTQGLADQLYRALGSISSDLAQGHSRRTGRDRARFYEYALGSARESRDWYYKTRHVLDDQVIHHRTQLLTAIIRILLTMLPEQRQRAMHDPDSPYMVRPDVDLQHLLDHVPMPKT